MIDILFPLWIHTQYTPVKNRGAFSFEDRQFSASNFHNLGINSGSKVPFTIATDPSLWSISNVHDFTVARDKN